MGRIGRDLGAVENGYRILANCGRSAHQEVFHLHADLFTGEDPGRMIKPADK